MDSLWRSRYPVEYWDNRLEKLNPYNSADRLDALVVLSELVSEYARTLVAKLREPDGGWATSCATVESWTVAETLDSLVTRTMDGRCVSVRNLLEPTPEGISYEPSTDALALDPADALTLDLLACPATVDGGDGVDFDVDPALYRASVDLLSTLRLEFRALVESASDGCRVIPLDETVLTSLVGERALQRNERLGSLRASLEETDRNLFVATDAGRSPSQAQPLEMAETVTCFRISVPDCLTAGRVALGHLRRLYGRPAGPEFGRHLTEMVGDHDDRRSPRGTPVERVVRFHPSDATADQ
ncbi:hypothetical protein VB779_09865 [Haloarculaceae archaeon H-GB11]|nr:hypothetical protein [Haloarculaceae archaeon H-GB11]